MTKGENTRKYIIKKSAELFNQRGYAGSSLSDITEVTGIKRGGFIVTLHVRMRLRLRHMITQ